MSNEYPMMLYRDGTQFRWDGRGTDSLIVADLDDHALAEKDGWQVAADYLSDATPAKTLLDGNAKDIEGALSELDADALKALRADEVRGKSRKSVIAAIDAEIKARA